MREATEPSGLDSVPLPPIFSPSLPLPLRDAVASTAAILTTAPRGCYAPFMLFLKRGSKPTPEFLGKAYWDFLKGLNY